MVRQGYDGRTEFSFQVPLDGFSTVRTSTTRYEVVRSIRQYEDRRFRRQLCNMADDISGDESRLVIDDGRGSVGDESMASEAPPVRISLPMIPAAGTQMPPPTVDSGVEAPSASEISVSDSVVSVEGPPDAEVPLTRDTLRTPGPANNVNPYARPGVAHALRTFTYLTGTPDDQPLLPDGSRFSSQDFALRLSLAMPQEGNFMDCLMRDSTEEARQDYLATIAEVVSFLAAMLIRKILCEGASSPP